MSTAAARRSTPRGNNITINQSLLRPSVSGGITGYSGTGGRQQLRLAAVGHRRRRRLRRHGLRHPRLLRPRQRHRGRQSGRRLHHGVRSPSPTAPGDTTGSGASASATVGANLGGLTKLSAGTLTLGGVNTYAGDTTISAGTLKVGVAGAIPSGAG